MRQGESRIPPILATVAALASQVLLSQDVVPGPRFLVPSLELVLLAALIAADPNRLTEESRDLRVPSLVFVGIIGAVNVVDIARLLNKLVAGKGTGREVLQAAAGVWLTNIVVFALAYWETDRGGPLGRAGARPFEGGPSLWFPQDGDAKDVAPPGWKPVFVDYLYVSFTASTAFSPTDTMPLTARAKLLMGTENLISLVTIGLVAARAVNILGP